MTHPSERKGAASRCDVTRGGEQEVRCNGAMSGGRPSSSWSGKSLAQRRKQKQQMIGGRALGLVQVVVSERGGRRWRQERYGPGREMLRLRAVLRPDLLLPSGAGGNGLVSCAGMDEARVWTRPFASRHPKEGAAVQPRPRPALPCDDQPPPNPP